MPWGMMEKLLEKSMCNAVRRKRYVGGGESSFLSCDHVDDDDDDGGVITERVKLPATKVYLPGNSLLVFDH